MSEIKLLPCPFCGEWKKIELKPFLKKKWYVECGSCFSAAFFSDSEEEAAKSWNTRKPIEDMVEQMESAKHEICLYGDDLDLYQRGLSKAIDIVRGGRE